VVEGSWIRPSAAFPAEPRWGHATGLRIGLAPLRGPRGLVQIFAPHLGHARERLVNFVAVEPTPSGATERGYSELEWSALDGERGKRFWSANDPADAEPGDLGRPARGVVDSVGGIERLSVFILVERLQNEADVFVRATFVEVRPYEVGLAASRRTGSANLDRLTLSATMGNYARLRRLRLADRIITSSELWPAFSGDGFTDHARFGLESLSRDEHGAAVVTATLDEQQPTTAEYAADTHEHWKYVGLRAVQCWRAADPRPGLEVLVNDRAAYWASSSPIPGGVSFENFELSELFVQGQEYVFSIEPML
jgi:hypothetical protein